MTPFYSFSCSCPQMPVAAIASIPVNPQTVIPLCAWPSSALVPMGRLPQPTLRTWKIRTLSFSHQALSGCMYNLRQIKGLEFISMFCYWLGNSVSYHLMDGEVDFSRSSTVIFDRKNDLEKHENEIEEQFLSSNLHTLEHYTTPVLTSPPQLCNYGLHFDCTTYFGFTLLLLVTKYY